MQSDRDRWNRKYTNRARSDDPAEILENFFSFAEKGRALDLAAGLGTHSLFLADQGFDVDAVDISDVAMDKLAGRHPRVNTICADLDTFNIPENRYSLIVNIRFLNRRLYPQITEGLIPGGLLIFETFLESPEAEAEPMRRDYLLRKNELLYAFLPLRILYYRETEEMTPDGFYSTAALVATKAASGN